MARKPWTEERRQKVAKTKAKNKEIKGKETLTKIVEVIAKDHPINTYLQGEEIKPLPPITQFTPPNWQGASMVQANEVMSPEELVEHQARVQRANAKRAEQEAQVKKVNEAQALVKDKPITFTNEVIDDRGIKTKYVVNPQPIAQQGTVAKYATVAELVKDMELKGASQDQITNAVDNFIDGGMYTPTMSQVDKLNTYARKPQVVTSGYMQVVENPPKPQPNFEVTTSVTDESSLFLNTSQEENLAIKQKEYAPKAGLGSMKLLFPTMKDTNPATCWALVQTAKRYGERLKLDMESGDSMIVNSRNKLASRFLDSGEEWSIWLDDDMIPQTGNPQWFRYMTFCDEWAESMGARKIPDENLSVHFIDRLLSHGKKIVGATYFGRQHTGRPMFHEGVENPAINRESRNYPNQLMETQWVGTGCLLIHRSVYLDMQRAYPQLAPTALMPQWDFFRLIPDKGEDASFCDRAIKIGHQPYVDLGLHCAHVGRASYGAWNTNNRQLGV
jgi:hypothetical protein